MKTSKHQKPKTANNSNLYFAIGLTVVLALTYFSLEFKSYASSNHYTQTLASEYWTPQEEIVQLPPPPKPQKPKYIPPQIMEVPDDTQEIETQVLSTESNQETDIDIHILPTEEDPVVAEEIIFIRVEEKPVFPGCENATNPTKCFNEMMVKHIQKTFKYPAIAQEMGIDGKVYMHFVIQKDGTIGDIAVARSPNEILSKEATRIITKLPKMKPGKQRGQAVKVPFNIPITFKLH